MKEMIVNLGVNLCEGRMKLVVESYNEGKTSNEDGYFFVNFLVLYGDHFHHLFKGVEEIFEIMLLFENSVDGESDAINFVPLH